jgi:hypothetical protein
MNRCPICGTTDFPPQKTECLRDRREAVSRGEKCEINEATRGIVLQCSERLKDYDVTVTQQPDGELILDFQNPDFENLLDDETLRGVVLLLWDKEVPPDQIRRLRLDEPERVNGVIRDGIDSLRNGTGKLTQEFRSHVLRWFQVEEGDMAERLNALAALQREFEALAVAASDKEISDETDQRVFEFLERYEDQQLPLWSRIPRAIAGLEG